MPEYLAPGVYIEETSFRSKSIEGVSTSTASFVGATRYGPANGEPELLTSFADFERIYGGLDQLSFGGVATTNFTAQAVRAFFQEGGSRCYVSRVVNTDATRASVPAASPPASPPAPAAAISARFVGSGGNMRITLFPRISSNVLVTGDGNVLRRVQANDTVLVRSVVTTSPPEFSAAIHDVVRNDEGDLELRGSGGSVTQIASLTDENEVYLLTIDVGVEKPRHRPKRPRDRYEPLELWQEYGFHPQHSNSLTRSFIATPATRRDHLYIPIFFDTDATTGFDLAADLLGETILTNLVNATSAEDRQRVFFLTGGTDGTLPTAAQYEGDDGATDGLKSGLRAFEDLEDISIVAAPGYSHNYTTENEARVRAIQGHLITHCEGIMRYRVAVLDAPNGQTLGDVRQFRGQIDSTHAALYYPWVTINDPVTEEELNLPPSGFVAGIYARNDVEHGVHKAPANEVVRLAIGFERLLNKAQQDVLNPEGINCFRFFEGRGYRLWGARTVSSDSEWKYVNVRRYFAYLERSIERGTQFAVFEPNGDALWANVTRTIEDFLFNEWKSGRLFGRQPKEAFFVRCDRTTMTQNDLDNGRLICLIGVAPLYPAEFVIFRIGQWTATASG